MGEYKKMNDKLLGSIKIAEMLGWEKTTLEFKMNYTFEEFCDDKISINDVPILSKDDEVQFLNSLDYSENYSKLMEAVEFIESIKDDSDNFLYSVKIESNLCVIQEHKMIFDSISRVYGLNKKDAIFKAILEFIKYKENKDDTNKNN